MDSASKNPTDLSPSTLPRSSHQTTFGRSVVPPEPANPATDDWSSAFDSDPPERGVRGTRTLQIGRKFICLEHDGDVILSGNFEGQIRIPPPKLPPQAPVPETLRRRVQPVHELAAASAQAEAESQALERLERGEPTYRDILDFVSRGEPGMYTLATLHAALCGWPATQSVRQIWVGKNPLYIEEFDDCESREERERAWNSLPQRRRDELLQQYGPKSPPGVASYRRRERFTQQIGLALEELQLPEYTGRGMLVVHPQNSKGRGRPRHVRAFMQSLPAWQRSGSFYEVVLR